MYIIAWHHIPFLVFCSHGHPCQGAKRVRKMNEYQNMNFWKRGDLLTSPTGIIVLILQKTNVKITVTILHTSVGKIGHIISYSPDSFVRFYNKL